MKPLVSIVIPVYNGGDYLRDAIESALGQTYRNIEVIVVNDGSTDGGATEMVAKSFGDRIRYLWKANGHVASALNFGIARMTGDYFSWLSHDDMYHADKVETQVRALAGLGRRTVLYSDFETLDVASGSVRPVPLPHVPPEQFRVFITFNTMLHGCTLLIPRECFDKCGLFNEVLRTTQDYDMWFRMAERYQFVHLPQILVTSRLHPGQGSRQLQGVALQECDQLLERFIADLSQEEIRNATGKSLSRAYGDIAVNMHARAFRRARNLAIGLVQRELRGESPLRAACPRLVLFARLAATPPGFRRLASKVLRQIRGLTTWTAPVFLGPRAVKDKFSCIYRLNAFGGRESRSGEGSGLEQTAKIRVEIPQVLRELGVRTMLDAACGDFNWMQHTPLPVELYIGVDIVDELIAANARRFANAVRKFLCLDITRDQLPPADLILCRDCLVHLNFRQAKDALRNFKASGATYLLTTTFTDRTQNADLVGSHVWRILNLQLPPFNLPRPVRIINENCTERNGAYSDKCLALWRLADVVVE